MSIERERFSAVAMCGRCRDVLGCGRVAAVLAAMLVAWGALDVSAAKASAGGWSRVDLSAAGQNGVTPQVAIAPTGEAIAVWVRFDGPLTSGGLNKNFNVQASVRPASGGFSAPVDLGAIDSSAVGGSGPQVAMGRIGDAVAVWQAPGGGIQAATRPAGGGFSAPVDLSPSDPSAAGGPRVAMDPAGNAVAVWASGGIVQAAARTAGGDFSAPMNVSPAGEQGRGPQVAMDQAGDAIIVWTRNNCSGGTCSHASTSVEAAVRSAGGGFSAAVTLSGGANATGPQTAMDGAGDAIVVWGQNYTGGVQAAVRGRDGSFSAPMDVGAGGDPRVAMDAAGDAVVLLGGSLVARPSGGSFSAPVAVNAGVVGGPAVAMDRAGDAVVVGGLNTVIQATARSASGSLSQPANLSASNKTGGYPQVAMNPAGNAVAVWQRDDSIGATNFIVQASTALAVASISRLRASPLAFPAADRGGSIARKPRRRTGTTITYTDTHASSTAFAVLKPAPGIKRRGRCVAPPRSHRIAPRTRCTRQLVVGSFTHRDRTGRNRLHFTGRVRGKKLAPGRYSLQATPRLPGIAGRTATTSFRITS